MKKDKINNTLIIGIIILFIGVGFQPAFANEISQSIKKIGENETFKINGKTSQENTAYFFCIIHVNGTGFYDRIPIIGTIFGVDGTISIKALYSLDIVTGKIIKFMDGCLLIGNYMMLTKWFIGTKRADNVNLVAHGFALCALAGIDEIP